MQGLSIAGTAAMFLVGGGILVHGIPGLHGWIEGLAARPAIGGMLRLTTSLLLDAFVGVVAGALVLAVVNSVQRVLRPRTAGR
jgi:predicted DNA repair protein MutK